MNVQKMLVEAAKSATKTPSGRWRAILAVPGKGSSGTYSAEMLKRFGPVAFPPNMKAYITHDENRDPRDLLGSYPEGAVWDENEGAEGALVSELEPLPRWADFVEEVAPHVGLSIFAMGKADKEGNVTELIPHRMNGVDMVGYAGLEGSSLGEKLSERAMTLLEEIRAATSADERKEEQVTPEELKAVMAEVLAPVFAFVAEQKLAAEAATAAKATESDKAPTVEDAVKAYAAASKAIAEAKLFPLQEAALLASAEKGEDVTKAIENAKALKDEAFKTVTESASNGGRRADANADNGNYETGLRWGN